MSIKESEEWLDHHLSGDKPMGMHFPCGCLLFFFLSKWADCSRAFGSAVQPAFRRISIFFFSKIECGLYLLDRFDVLISKMIFKK